MVQLHPVFLKNQIDTCANIERSLRYIKGKNERYRTFLLNICDYICNRKFGEGYAGNY